LPTAPWDTYLLKNKQGAYLPCLANAVRILTHRKEWRDVIALDAFAGVVVKKKPPPWTADIKPDTEDNCDWTQSDSARAAFWLSDEYLCSFYTSVIDEAVQLIAETKKFHPVQEYLRDVHGAHNQWDRKDRIEDLLIRVAGAPDNVYTRAVTKNFFLGAVARIMRPGAQVDTVLILEGAQGAGKSTFFRTLASDEWFFDTVFNIGGKDGYQALRRKWIVEFSELDALGSADLARVKAFISSVKDSYRPSYGKTTIDFPRQCVFAGTVNPNGAGYLNDTTGARRFWPVTVGKVDLKTVQEERDDLWAEAFWRYGKNQKWHLRDEKLLAAAALEVEARRESDPWETHFREFLHMNRGLYRKHGVTIPTLLTEAVDVTKDKQNRATQIQAGKALKAIGWTRIERGSDDVRRYFPAESSASRALKVVPSSSIPPIGKGGLRGGSDRKGTKGSVGGS
jgi:putative DNA primase/helicase